MSAHAYGLSLLRRGPVPRLVSIMAAMILAAVGAQTAPVAARVTPIAGSRVIYPASACAQSTDPHSVTCDLVDGPAAPGRSALAGSAPAGYTPDDLRAAYHLTERSGRVVGGTIAIVDPFDDPFAETDLAEYRAFFNLPACTASGCFRKVNQNGSSSPLPAANLTWAKEVSVDLDMVSAICPLCHIVLVEANDIQDKNMFAAEDWATAHARFVSNSWSNPEDSGDAAFDPHLDRPGVVITASNGDTGTGPRYPATNSHVIAVGGTSLTRSGSHFREVAWGRAGSGCSAFEPKPAWQPPVAGCANRAEADVSAVADPNHGVAVFEGGWLVEGGTSVAAPIIAATFALATPPRPGDYPASYLYSHASWLRDVTSGSSNGGCGAPICKPGIGWDGPTGLGTPNTVAAFAWYDPLQSNPPDQTGQVGIPISVNLAAFASGGIPPYHWFASVTPTQLLPPGLTLDGSTGLISGTPTSPGTYTSCYEMVDSSAHGNRVDDCMTWVINNVTVTVPNIVGDALPAAQGALGSVGLSLGTETDKGTTSCDLVGSIGSQNPAAGSVVSKGSSVDFTMWVLKPGSHCQ
jgi:Putative Ig domain/PASTA domain/Subtilase family